MTKYNKKSYTIIFKDGDRMDVEYTARQLKNAQVLADRTGAMIVEAGDHHE